MKQVVIVKTCAGRWLYTIYIDGRAVVFGQATTRERAEIEARVA